MDIDSIIDPLGFFLPSQLDVFVDLCTGPICTGPGMGSYSEVGHQVRINVGRGAAGTLSERNGLLRTPSRTASLLDVGRGCGWVT